MYPELVIIMTDLGSEESEAEGGEDDGNEGREEHIVDLNGLCSPALSCTTQQSAMEYGS
jgi:hypothetical protein